MSALSHSYAIGFPGMSLQRSDKRWAQIAEHLFFLTELDISDSIHIGVFSTDVYESYCDESRYAIYVYSNDSLREQMVNRERVIKLRLDRFLSPYLSAEREIADNELKDICKKMNLNVSFHGEDITIELPVPYEYQQSLVDQYTGI